MIHLAQCAGCGAKDAAFSGLSDLASEFCGQCNRRYAESLNAVHPDALREGERLQREATIYHLNVGYGELDELCCPKCYEYTRWLDTVRNSMGDVPAGIDEPEVLWVRVARKVVEDFSRLKLEADVTSRLAILRLDIKRYEQRGF
jgi:hypothetical protein